VAEYLRTLGAEIIGIFKRWLPMVIYDCVLNKLT